MSRKGKIPVSVPKGVKVNISEQMVKVEGPKGKLDLNLPLGISVKQDAEVLVVEKKANSKQDRANHGTIRSRLANMMKGVTEGHKKSLEIHGLGFRAELKGDKIAFNLGLSHPVEFQIDKNVKVTVPSQTSIEVEGIDNVLVGQVAANIKKLKKPEPYKGKGIRYAGEHIRRKQGKSAAK